MSSVSFEWIGQMSPRARYRAANWTMWLVIGLFTSMALVGASLAPLTQQAGVVFVIVLFATIAIGGLSFALAVYAFATVRCGHCDSRFFDFVFLAFPVQGGCRNCHASIDHAVTTRLLRPPSNDQT